MMSSKRSSSTPTSAAIVLGNDDLLTEILVLLSTKPLVRLKVVSKRWCSLISAPSFCRLHTANHRFCYPETQPLFIIGSRSYGFPKANKYRVYNPAGHRFSSLSFPLGFTKVRILQSCNGLLLLRCGKDEEHDSPSYHVFNPTTMQQREMSPLPTSSGVAAIYLLFDPSLSLHYKVVCFTYAKPATRTLIHVYDSEMHKWKLGDECNKRASTFCKGVYFNGGIYFLRVGNSSSFRFDPDNNVSKIPNPPRHFSRGMRNENHAMESNGVLLSLTLSAKEGCNLLYVSELKENENRWTKKYQTDLNLIMAFCGGHDCRSMDLLGMIRGEKEQDSLLMFRLQAKIKIYKFYDDVFEDLYDVASKEFRTKYQEWYVEDVHHFFIRSLAPV